MYVNKCFSYLTLKILFLVFDFLMYSMCTVDIHAIVCVPPFLRTLITGMASGSIVAFNIDFNRWHYEHQNRY